MLRNILKWRCEWEWHHLLLNTLLWSDLLVAVVIIAYFLLETAPLLETHGKWCLTCLGHSSSSQGWTWPRRGQLASSHVELGSGLRGEFVPLWQLGPSSQDSHLGMKEEWPVLREGEEQQTDKRQRAEPEEPCRPIPARQEISQPEGFAQDSWDALRAQLSPRLLFVKALPTFWYLRPQEQSSRYQAFLLNITDIFSQSVNYCG